MQSIQHACRNADYVFGGSADFGTDQILSKIKTDQIAGKSVDKGVFGILVVGVDDHTIGNPDNQFLHMPGTHPNSQL